MSPELVPAPWLIPDWPVPVGVRAFCTTRAGGVSPPPYDSLNLGLHVGDAPEHVAENRARLLEPLRGARAVWMEQVHGTDCLNLSQQTLDGQVADVAWTRHRDLACTVMVADCLPVLFADKRGTQVAAAHAGWRGLLGQDSNLSSNGWGVLEAAVHSFVDTRSADLLAWLGPCIGPAAFEVGPEVRDAFVSQRPEAGPHFRAIPGGKWLADLAALARQRLSALGVSAVYGNDSTPPWCTVSQPSRFFSHRRDRVSGRLAACVWLEGRGVAR